MKYRVIKRAYMAMGLSLVVLGLVIIGSGSDGFSVTLLSRGTALASLLPFKWWLNYDPDIHAVIEQIVYEDKAEETHDSV